MAICMCDFPRTIPGDPYVCADCKQQITQRSNICKDPIVEAVRTDLLQRSHVGLKKHGVPLTRTDLNLKDWLQHAYEEALDSANYLKRCIVELEKTE